MKDDTADANGRSGDAIRPIADQLRRYLKAHPHAADSLPGIVEWWLERQCARWATGQVREALDWLVTEGAVLRERTLDGGVVYRARDEEVD